jgi:hypothetical protein
MEDGVLDVSGNRVGMEQAFKNVSNDDKKVRGEGVSLPETALTVDPIPRHAIEQNGGLASVKKVLDPRTPSICEPPRTQDPDKAVPGDAVEGFMKIKLENDGRAAPAVAAIQQVRSIDKIISNATALHKTRLIRGDKGGDQRLEAGG